MDRPNTAAQSLLTRPKAHLALAAAVVGDLSAALQSAPSEQQSEIDMGLEGVFVGGKQGQKILYTMTGDRSSYERD
jgi:hypothetical protein